MKLVAIPLSRTRKLLFCAFCSAQLRRRAFKIVPAESIQGGPVKPVYVHRPGECHPDGKRRPDISIEFAKAATVEMGRVLRPKKEPSQYVKDRDRMLGEMQRALVD